MKKKGREAAALQALGFVVQGKHLQGVFFVNG